MLTRQSALLALCFALIPVAALAAPGGTYDAWVQYRDTLAKDPGLVRLYTFEDIAADGQVRDLSPSAKPLSYSVMPGDDGTEAQPRRIEGRWPQKRAVRIDRGMFTADAFEPKDRAFTVSAWVRMNGLGHLQGDSVPTGATFLQAGNGYWSGWRLTMSYADKSIGLEIGRPAPSSALGCRSGPSCDGVWRHVAATWDGKQMRVYLDGLLAAAGPFTDAYTGGNGPGLRIGFADSGWGSMVLDVDEVAAFDRALSPAEIARAAYFFEPLPDALAARLTAAAEATAKGDTAATIAAYQGLIAAPGVPPTIAAGARLGLGQAQLQAHDNATALRSLNAVVQAPAATDALKAAAFAPLLQLARQSDEGVSRRVYEMMLAQPGLSPQDTILAKLKLARACRKEGDLATATRLEAEVLKMDGLTPRDRANVILQVGNSAAQAHDYPGARDAYAKIAALTDAPPQFRSYAHLLIAATLVREKSYPAAKAEYTKLAADETAPSQHRWEAEECAREVERLQAGRPARDPNSSRVKLPKFATPGREFYVATDGADDNPGTRAKPFATLTSARDAIRALKGRGPLPPGGIAVIIRPGEYRLADSFKLEAGDSGAEAAPIVYRAEKPGTVRITGGLALRDFQPVQDPAILARLPEESRAKVVQCDLKALGVTDFGKLAPRGFSHGSSPPPAIQLFFDGQPLTLARWPNEGFLKTGKVLDEGQSGGRGALFEFANDRLNRWAQAKDIWVFGYWRWLWADEALDVTEVDAKAGTIRTGATSGYGMAAGQPFYFQNLLEELDQPGEWYLDRATGIVYMYPPSDPAKAVIQFPVLNSPLVQMDEVAHVSLQGLTLELGRADAIVSKGGSHCLIAGCTIRQMGNTGVTIDGGNDYGVFGCDIHTLGRGGVWIKGGDRKTLTPSGHFVENCRIHDFSHVDRTYTPAVYMDGVAIRIAHNEMYDTPCHGMRIEGNDHIVEFNNVHDVVRESDDQGGIDIFLNPSYRGNIFRYNFWHDIGDGTDPPCGRAGIRLDDAISGTLIYGNVFCKSSYGGFGGVQVHGGKENILENNLFVNCHYGVSFSGWGAARWKQFVEGPDVKKLTTEDVDIAKPPYSTKYPLLADLGAREGTNWVSRNVAFNCGSLMTRDRDIQDVMDNLTTSDDPGFVDAKAADFRLKSNAPLLDRIGFRPIPFAEIGPYASELRAW